MKYNILGAAIIALAVVLCGCQATPQQEVIQSKGNLQEKIEEATVENAYEDLENFIKYTKQLSDNQVIEINAEIYGAKANSLPVYDIYEKEYKSESTENAIYEAFSEYKIYDYTPTTKQSLMEDLEMYQLWLERYRNGLDCITGEPVESEWDQSAIRLAKKFQVEVKEGEDPPPSPSKEENILALIEEAKAELQNALSENDLQPPNFEFEESEHRDSEAVSLRLIGNHEDLIVSIANWRASPGTTFYLTNENISFGEDYGTFSPKLYREFELKDNTEFLKVKKYCDNLVKKLDADHLSINRAQIDEEHNAYRLIYTRNMNGLAENYITSYYAPTPTDSEGGEYIPLWGRESLIVDIKDGKIAMIDWENSSEVEQITENAKVLDFEQILNIAKKQLEYIVSSKTQNNAIDDGIKEGIGIDRIELCYTKMLVQNSYDKYQLIPTWSFWGYDNSMPEREICFLTINAIDGSVMDYNNGY